MSFRSLATPKFKLFSFCATASFEISIEPVECKSYWNKKRQRAKANSSVHTSTGHQLYTFRPSRIVMHVQQIPSTCKNQQHKTMKSGLQRESVRVPSPLKSHSIEWRRRMGRCEEENHLLQKRRAPPLGDVFTWKKKQCRNNNRFSFQINTPMLEMSNKKPNKTCQKFMDFFAFVIDSA